MMSIRSVDARRTVVVVEHCDDEDSVTVYRVALEWDSYYPGMSPGWALLDISPEPPPGLQDDIHSEAIEALEKERCQALWDERDARAERGDW